MQVTKIIEGGIDLTTGTELDIGIVVSNGTRELMIPINTATLQMLTVMIAEANLMKDPKVMVPEELKKRALPVEQGPQLVPIDEPPMSPPAGFTVQDTEPEMDDEEGFEPGEEYNDVGTGASSL